MAPPSWLRVRVKLFIENYATPILCALGVAGYQAASLKWPFIAQAATAAGIDPVAVNGFIVAAMAFVANLIDRAWAAPVFQTPMTQAEAVTELKAEDKAALAK